MNGIGAQAVRYSVFYRSACAHNCASRRVGRLRTVRGVVVQEVSMVGTNGVSVKTRVKASKAPTAFLRAVET